MRVALSSLKPADQFRPRLFRHDPFLEHNLSLKTQTLKHSIESFNARCPAIEKEAILQLLKVRLIRYSLKEITKWICDSFLEDIDFILLAIKYGLFSLSYANQSQRTNRRIAIASVATNPAEYQSVDSSLKSKDFLIEAICQSDFSYECFNAFKKTLLPLIDQNDWLVLLKADTKLSEYVPTSRISRVFALEAAEKCGAILAGFKDDKEIVLAAVTTNGLALQHACGSSARDREVVLTAVKQNGLSYKYIPAPGKYFVGTACVLDCDIDLRNDPEIMLEAVKQNGEAIKDMWIFEALNGNAICHSTIIYQYSDIFEAAIAQNPSLIKIFSPQDARTIAWLPGINIADLNIEWYSRFQEQDLQEILNNRRNVHLVDARPLAVLIYPKYDYPQRDELGITGYAFDNNQINLLIKQGFRVLYYEVSTVDELIMAVTEATTPQKARLLEIAGHGTKTSIQLGKYTHITLEDEEKIRKGIGNCLEEDGVGIVVACSAASDIGDNKNIANMLKRALSCARLFALKIASSVKSYEFFDRTNSTRMFWVNHSSSEATSVL